MDMSKPIDLTNVEINKPANKSDKIIDLSFDYLQIVEEKLNSYIKSAQVNFPDGAIMIKDWFISAKSKYTEFQLANMIYQAEQNGDFDLTQAQVYEETEAQAVIDKMLTYLVIDDTGFEWGIQVPKVPNRLTPEEIERVEKLKEANPTKIVSPKYELAKLSAEIDSDKEKYTVYKSFAEGMEKNESISGLGTAFDEGADLELPFEKYKRKHNK